VIRISGTGRVDDVLIKDIHIGQRCRKDMGDIAALAQSIEQVGLIQPVILTTGHRLIAGHRRIEAYKLLGRSRVPAIILRGVVDALTALKAERDENTCRKPLAPSEAVSLGRAIEQLVAKEARRRQQEGGQKGGKESGKTRRGEKREACGNLPQASQARTRDKVAESVGMSARTYEKAKAVVEAAEKDPERFTYAVHEMDRSGKVDRAYQEVARRQAGEGIRARNGASAPASADVADFETQVDAARRLGEALAQTPVDRLTEAISAEKAERYAGILDKAANQFYNLALALRARMSRGSAS
jgi:ParB-like chromosome segregation protein Spo0J